MMDVTLTKYCCARIRTKTSAAILFHSFFLSVVQLDYMHKTSIKLLECLMNRKGSNQIPKNGAIHFLDGRTGNSCAFSPLHERIAFCWRAFELDIYFSLPVKTYYLHNHKKRVGKGLKNVQYVNTWITRELRSKTWRMQMLHWDFKI